MKHLVSGLLLSLAISGAAWAGPTPPARRAATQKHLIYFKDKAGSPFQLDQPDAFLSARAQARRQRQNIALTAQDLPVNPSYVAQLKAVPGVSYWYPSRWFNAVMISCDDATLAQVQALPFVRQASPLNRKKTAAPASDTYAPVSAATQRSVAGRRSDYGKAYAQAVQLGAVAMHDAGYRGEDMHIAVFDAGFPGVDKLTPFQPLFAENRLASTYNFVDKQPAVFLRDGHGTSVLSTMAASQPGFFTGTAPKATYHLCITEDVASETPVEEMNWLIAAEYADSVGVDIITSSLGYTTFPDFPAATHTYAELDGNTAIGTRAADLAARVGILVLNSAGNDGNGAWRYIGVPADADSIIAVGAVDSVGIRSGFSSVGPTADGRIKPDLAARGGQAAVIRPSGAVVLGNGTSYACPILAGMTAGFWQANRNRTAQEIIALLKQSGTQAAAPDNLLGYGIPDFVRAYNLANPGTPLGTRPVHNRGEVRVYPNPSEADQFFLTLPAELQRRPVQVRIFDTLGRLVSEQTLVGAAGPAQLSAAHLIAGTYSCLVNAGTVQYATRFVRR
ncbi:S8 family serine peptidase [Hymenobacter lutimineralis]|nr:S8 family serine peptidase [Hymenobacter lutimineralis]